MRPDRLDFNPAGTYLRELRARGLVRKREPAAPSESADPAIEHRAQLPLAKVLRVARLEPQSLNDVQQAAGVDAEDFIAAVDRLTKQDLVRVLEADDGLELELTIDGAALQIVSDGEAASER